MKSFLFSLFYTMVLSIGVGAQNTGTTSQNTIKVNDGRFIIDAERKGGKTKKVKIAATVDQSFRLKNPFSQPEYQSNIKSKEDGTELLCQLKVGQTLVITVNRKFIK